MEHGIRLVSILFYILINLSLHLHCMTPVMAYVKQASLLKLEFLHNVGILVKYFQEKIRNCYEHFFQPNLPQLEWPFSWCHIICTSCTLARHGRFPFIFVDKLYFGIKTNGDRERNRQIFVRANLLCAFQINISRSSVIWNTNMN